MEQNMESLISIVLPIYNGEKYMRKSIDSVLAQTYANWELLIIDDGSTDNTAVIAQEYAAKDSRIRYYKNPENMRLPRTLNRGFSLAKGDFLTWTSDDNYYYPTALETMHNALVQPGKEFAFAACDVINGEGDIVECITVSDAAKKSIVGTNPVGACFLYSRKVYETVGEYDPEMTLVEDFDYWQRSSGSIMGEEYSLKRLDAIEAKVQRHAYIKENFPMLENLSAKDLWFTCIYQGQMAVRKSSPDTVKIVMTYLKKVLLETSVDTRSCGIKKKLWLMFAKHNMYATCRVRNILGIGL